MIKQMKEIRGQINYILKSELEKKLRCVKQSCYESGPKSTKMLACRLKKQHALNTVYKIQDPMTKQLVYEPEKIEIIFENYFKSLYIQPPAANIGRMKKKIKHPRSTHDWFNTEQHFHCTNHNGRSRESDKWAKKNNKSPGSDGFPSEWYKMLREEFKPI